MKHGTAAPLSSFLACLALVCATRVAVATPRAEGAPPTIEDFVGKRVVEIDVTGVEWGADLKRILPLRAGMPLSRDRLQRCIRAFDSWADSSRQINRVRAFANLATVGGVAGVRLEFRVEPLRKIVHVSLQNTAPIDTGALLHALDLPTGTEFWPDRVNEAASRVARLYFRQGWRETEVEWQAVPDAQTVQLTFIVHRSAPTNLVRIEFKGDKGLPDSELLSSFGLRPGARLSLGAIDDGIVALKERFRNNRFYRASVKTPVVEAGFGLAVVTIPLEAGPRFTIQLRGNKSIDDSLLLAQLKYAGEEALDEYTQRDLAERLRAFYELAGFPHAKVEKFEDTVRAPWATSSPGGLPGDAPVGAQPLIDTNPDVLSPPLRVEEHLVTFRIHEGPPVRVVARKFTGHPIPEIKESDMLRHIDVALRDAVPAVLVESRDSATMRAARLGGSPGAATIANPRVRTEEVFSTVAYKKACDEIKNLYAAQGYLDAEITPARLQNEVAGTATVVIAIDPKAQKHVGSVAYDVDAEGDVPTDKIWHAITVHVGQPFTVLNVENTRAAILQLYFDSGHVFATVDDEDKPILSDPDLFAVQFHVHEGPIVRVSSVDIKGTDRATARLVRQVLKLHDGDVITPDAQHESASNIFKLNVFASESVEPVRPGTDTIEPPTLPIAVRVQEKPGLSLDTSVGISIVDGPRVGAQLSAAHFLGTNDTFISNVKLDVPIFRFCLFPSGINKCPPGSPTDPIERQISVGMIFPVFGPPGEDPVNQRVDLIQENLLRPSYYLEKVSVLGTLSGLGVKKWGPKAHPWLTLSPVFLLEAEYDYFTKTNTNADYVETVADQKALLLPTGPTALASFRPKLNLDARDDKLNPTSGWIASLGFDFAQDFINSIGATQFTRVSMVSTLLTAGGYIPIYKPRHVIFALSGRAGYILALPGTEVIGTKVFFLGGTASIRGFNEDEIIPQDVRPLLHQSLNACTAVVSQVGCDSTSTALLSNAASYTSQGGKVVLAARGELRFGLLPDSLDADVFLDAGNLWSNPADVSLKDPVNDLRYGAGFGLRLPLPIGPAALDFGFNLNPDTVLGETLFRLHFSVGI